MNKKEEKVLCPAAKILSLLSEKHVLTLIYNLAPGPKGFNDLQEDLGVNTATLAKRLSGLEEGGFVEKISCKTDSRRHYYSLTSRGRKLSKHINSLAKV